MKRNQVWNVALSTALTMVLAAQWAGSSAFGQATPATTPAVAPAAKAPPLTAEQKAVVDEIRKNDVPTTAYPKMDINPVNKDGTPNDNFGKPN